MRANKKAWASQLCYKTMVYVHDYQTNDFYLIIFLVRIMNSVAWSHPLVHSHINWFVQRGSALKMPVQTVNFRLHISQEME